MTESKYRFKALNGVLPAIPINDHNIRSEAFDALWRSRLFLLAGIHYGLATLRATAIKYIGRINGDLRYGWNSSISLWPSFENSRSAGPRVAPRKRNLLIIGFSFKRSKARDASRCKR